MGSSHDLDAFMWAFMDDIAYLEDAREALLFHPKVKVLPQWATASLVRQLAVSASSLADVILVELNGHAVLGPAAEALREYLKHGTAGRFADAREVLAGLGTDAKQDVLCDLYALRQLRNALVHADWKPSKTDEDRSSGMRKRLLDDSFLAEHVAGGVLNLQSFDFRHWERILFIIAEMQRYLMEAVAGPLPTLESPLTHREFFTVVDGEFPRDIARSLVDSGNERVTGTATTTSSNLNYAPTLCVPWIRAQYMRNVERFVNNLQGEYEPREGDPSWVWQHVTESEFSAILETLRGSGLTMRALESFAYELSRVLAVARSGGNLTSNSDTLRSDHEIAVASWNEWLGKFAEADLMPSVEALDALQNVSAAQVLRIVQESTEPTPNLSVRRHVGPISRGDTGRACEAFGRNSAAEFLLVSSPVGRAVMGGSLPDTRPWLMGGLRLAALDAYVTRGSTHDLQHLAWAELVSELVGNAFH